MKIFFSKPVWIILLIFSNIGIYAQSNKQVIADLNEVLEKSLYKTEITVDEDGTLHREDNNGNTFTFNLKDVREVDSGNDGFQNLFIRLNKGKISRGIVGGKQIDSEFNVIAFRNPDDCKLAIEKFRELINMYH